MGVLIYPNECKIEGPWMISSDHLNELHEIIEREWNRIKPKWEKFIEEEAEKKIEAYGWKDKTIKSVAEDLKKDSPLKKVVTVHFENGKKLVTDNIKDAILDKEAKNQEANGIEIYIIEDRITKLFEFSIDRDLNRIRWAVDKKTDEYDSRLYSEIDRWSERCKPSKWLNIWKSWAGIHWFVYAFLALYPITLLPSETDIARSKFKADGQKLLVGGLQKDEVNKALEIMLALQSEYVPQDKIKVAWKNSKRFAIYQIVMLIVTIILSFPPKVQIGIGIGDLKVQRWRKWLKLIYYTIPFVIFTGIILPLFVEKIKVIF